MKTNPQSVLAPHVSTVAPGWRWAKLGDVTDGPGQYGTSQKATRQETGLPVLRMGNLRDGRIAWENLKYVALPRAEEDKFRLVAGDILFNRTNSAELVGKSAVFDSAQDAVFASYLIRFRARPSVVEPEYLCAYINSRFGRAFIVANMARAVGQANISASAMQRFPVPVPPLDEQRRIVGLLRDRNEATSRIQAASESQLGATKCLQAALLRHSFGEQWPLSFSADLPRTSASNKWRWVSLLEVAQLESGHTPSRSEPSYWGGNVPWISLKDMTALKDIYINDTVDHPTMIGIENSAARILPEGTVVLSRTASVGHSAIMGRPMATSQDFANWICKPDLNPLFLLFVFRGSLPVLERASDGATHKTIYMPTLKRAKIILPPLPEQLEIVARLREGWTQAWAVETAAVRRTALLDGLTGCVRDEVFAHMAEGR
jgi:type I restriction enzyme, S subunit